MNKGINTLLCGLFMMVIGTAAMADSVAVIDSYGVYVVADRGYVKIDDYKHDYRFADFKYLNEVPYVIRGSDELKLVIYQKEFQPAAVEFEVRPLDIKVKLQKVGFSVKPLEKTDMYELTVDARVKDGAMLQVNFWPIFQGIGIVMLGDTQGELVKFFNQKNMPKAAVVAQYLDDALIAFPGNSKLQELGIFWKQAAEKEKDNEAYAYVEEKWQQYENAEKLTLKERYLNALIIEINGYLSDHPDGLKADEALQRKILAEKKLKEYEKLL